MDQGIRDDLQIRPAHRRAQIGACGAGAESPAACLLHPADMIAKAMRQIVQVLPVGPAHPLTGLDSGFAQCRLVPILRREERAAFRMHVVRWAFPVFCLPEIGKGTGGVPTPVSQLRPMVVILRLGADIDHAVDRTRPTQDAPPGIWNFPSVQTRVLVRRESPGHLWMIHDLHVASGDMDVRIGVLAAGLQQKDAQVRVLRQSVGEHTTGRAGADNHIIRLHGIFPRDGVCALIPT